MNAVVRHEAAALPALQMPEGELLQVLQSSLYPGAAPASIKMVLGYCRAAALDPMQKPVHIVPMWDNKAKQMRDVVMPGIGLYRIQAARTGEHVGTDKPVYGPLVELKIGDFTFFHPEWCEVTVYRMKNGVKCAYTAQEYWIENYATAGKDSAAPNTMWKKRTRGQIAKCAEAQALRKGFPEVGSVPTADEMDGKQFDDFAGTTIDAATGDVHTPPAPPSFYPQAEFDAKLPAWLEAIAKGKATADAVIAKASTKHPLTDEQKSAIRNGKVAAPAPAPAPAAPAITYAEVADKLTKATTAEKLEEAADLIVAVADTGQQEELHALYEQRVAAITPKE